MKIYIKNMVCQGTKHVVHLELKRLGIGYKKFELGEIDLEEDLSLAEIRQLDDSLRRYGLAIIFRNSKIVDKIRNAVNDLVNNKVTLKTSFSFYISDSLSINYTYLSEYFKIETGIPIEEYFIEKKNEKTKTHEPAWSDTFNLQEKSA
jgi:AraC family transcriptional regulator